MKENLNVVPEGETPLSAASMQQESQDRKRTHLPPKNKDGFKEAEEEPRWHSCENRHQPWKPKQAS